jgi:hypothetical protein
MGRVCSVCSHASHAAIDSQLRDPAHLPFAHIASAFGLKRDAIHRHRHHHLVVHTLPVKVDRRLSTGSHNRRDRQTARARERFLEAYAQCGHISRAAEAAGIARATVYVWQEHDPEFAAAFREAGITATESLEQEAWRRAVDGVPEPVFQHGKQVGTIQRYSDQLLMCLLRARAPERYRDKVDVSVTPVIKAVAGFDPQDVL